MKYSKQSGTNKTKVENAEKLHSIKKLIQQNENVNVLSLINRFPIGVCITNKEGEYEDVNDAYCQMYGYSRKELIGKSFTKVVPEGQKQYLQDLHDEFLNKKFELTDIWRVIKKGGEEFYVLANAAHFEISGKLRKCTLVSDITNLKESEESLNRTIENLKNEVEENKTSSNLVIHDIKEPLSSMVGIADMLLETENSEEELKKWLHSIKDLGTRTLSSIELLINLQKMEEGIYKLRYEKLDVKQFASELRKRHQFMLEDKNIDLIMVGKDNEPLSEQNNYVVNADCAMLEYLMDNLVINSVQASPEQSKIKIGFSLEKQELLLITIHNTGEIPDEIKGRVFEKYVTKGKKKGSGLGTYIAKLIAQYHNGAIRHSTPKEGETLIEVELKVKPI